MNSIVVSGTTKAELIAQGKATEDEFEDFKTHDRAWYTPKPQWTPKVKPKSTDVNYDTWRDGVYLYDAVEHWSNRH